MIGTERQHLPDPKSLKILQPGKYDSIPTIATVECLRKVLEGERVDTVNNGHSRDSIR